MTLGSTPRPSLRKLFFATRGFAAGSNFQISQSLGSSQIRQVHNTNGACKVEKVDLRRRFFWQWVISDGPCNCEHHSWQLNLLYHFLLLSQLMSPRFCNSRPQVHLMSKAFSICFILCFQRLGVWKLFHLSFKFISQNSNKSCGTIIHWVQETESRVQPKTCIFRSFSGDHLQPRNAKLLACQQ